MTQIGSEPELPDSAYEKKRMTRASARPTTNAITVEVASTAG